MTTSDMVKELCVKLNISISELSRRIGQTPQNFNKKLKRNTVTVEELIEMIDGVRMTTASETRVLKTKGAEIISVKMAFKDLFLHSLSNPNIAYILLFLGIYGILGEFSHPGSFFPGIVGGISTGMPIIFTCAVKPTSTIGKQQKTVDLKSLESVTVAFEGNHDPCIVPRVIPVIESLTAIVLVDVLIENGIIPLKIENK